MTNRRLPQFVAQYFSCVNGDRLDELMELFHPDAELFMPLSEPLHGRDAIRSFYAKVPQWFPQHVDDPVRVWQDGDAYAVEIEFRGTTPDEKKVEFRAVDIMDVVDGRLRRLQTFYDGAAVLRQRGR